MKVLYRSILFTSFLFVGVALAQNAGETVYQSNCAACHQANGQGIPGAFPPLAGHVPELLNADGGRQYIIHVLLYGLQGQISVNGQTFNGMMPAWSQLSDDQIAGVLNHVASAWENQAALPKGFQEFTAEEVSAERNLGLAPTDVHAQRAEVLGE